MPPTKAASPQLLCPCGSKKCLASCCLPYIKRQTLAPTAETLMRSRYTAHVLLAIDYLWDTLSQKQRIDSNKEAILYWASSCQWQGLDILSITNGTENDQEGIVAFCAKYKRQGKFYKHNEVSTFKKIEDIWLYSGHAE